jgi:hypothetical protein
VTKQAVGCWRVSSHHFHPLISFEAQTDKPHPTWFWCPNQEIAWFSGLNQETVKIVLRPNHWQLVATGFEAKPENPRFSSPPRVWCGSHTAPPDLPIVQPPSTRLVSDHPRSSAPSLLLLPRSSSLPTMSHSPPTHHETSKHISPHWITQYRLVQPKCAKFKFKLEQVNYSWNI